MIVSDRMYRDLEALIKSGKSVSASVNEITKKYRLYPGRVTADFVAYQKKLTDIAKNIRGKMPH